MNKNIQRIIKQPMQKNYFSHLLLQVLAATVFMWLVLFSLDHVAASKIMWAVGASTLASSTFLTFCAPQSPVAQPQKMIGAYLIAAVVGGVMRYVAMGACAFLPHCTINDGYHLLFEVAGAITVALSMLLMLLRRLEHPPAAGLAVVMVLDIRQLEVLLVILGGAVVLAAIHWLFRKHLYHLIL